MKNAVALTIAASSGDRPGTFGYRDRWSATLPAAVLFAVLAVEGPLPSRGLAAEGANRRVELV